MTLDDFQVFLHTFHAVFPHVQVYGYHPGMLLFLGSETPLRLQPDRLAALRAQPGIAQDLVRIGMTDPAAILGGLLLDTGLVAELSAGARTNTDDRPWLEFSTPRALHLPGVRARVEAFLGDRGPLPGFLTAQGVAEPDVRVATFYQAAFRQHLDRVEALLPRYLEDGPLSGSLLPVLRRAYWDQGAQRRYYDLVKQLQAGAGGDPGLLLMEQVMTGMTLWEGGGMPDPSERALLRQELLALIHRAGEVGLQLTNREEILQKLARDPALPPESP